MLRAVCVVAHPDDEAMWFGGMISGTRRFIEWTVIACSIPRRDPERVLKFYDACAALGAIPRILPYVEPDNQNLDGLDKLDITPWRLVATHNEAGEYGNPHHVLVHHAVRKAHRVGRLFVPGYGIEPGPISFTADASKLKAIRCYNHTTAVDRKPKWEALLAVYGDKFDLNQETYYELCR
jgi:hypothetical protein